MTRKKEWKPSPNRGFFDIELLHPTWERFCDSLRRHRHRMSKAETERAILQWEYDEAIIQERRRRDARRAERAQRQQQQQNPFASGSVRINDHRKSNAVYQK